MSKSFWSILLLIGLAITLAACSGNNDSAENDSSVGHVVVSCNDERYEGVYDLELGQNTFTMRKIPGSCIGIAEFKNSVACVATYFFSQGNIPYEENWDLREDKFLKGNKVGGTTTVECSLRD